MDSYPPGFAGGVKALAEEARLWVYAQAHQHPEDADARFTRMETIQGELLAQGVLGDDPCQQLHDMATSTGAVTLCRTLGMEGLDGRLEDFEHACTPLPSEVSGKLWRQTQQLFWAAASFACADVTSDAQAVNEEERKYHRQARRIGGLGKNASSRLAPMKDDVYAREVAAVMPAVVISVSGCMDSQTSADVSNTASFGLPSDAGPGGAGGACTSAMIKALAETSDHTWVSLLKRMREILDGKYTQIPILSSSKQMDLNIPVKLVGCDSGRRRALLVGINYVGSNCELKGCHNDVETMRRFLVDHGFAEGDLRILLDDGDHEAPTRVNIMEGLKSLSNGAEAGDSLFFHYSGHGSSVPDEDGDEADGKDEVLCPVDYDKGGMLRDDEIYLLLVAPLKEGVSLTCVLDCCHSGTIIDLPFVFKADDGNLEAASSGTVGMSQNADFDFGKIMEVARAHPALAAGVALVASAVYFAKGPDNAQKFAGYLTSVAASDDPMSALKAGAGRMLSFLK